jgi:ankyrin repeat protein
VLARAANVNEKSHDGTTALLAAAKKGRTSVINILLVRGADLNARDNDGKTALAYAKKNGYTRLAQSLQKAGAVE